MSAANSHAPQMVGNYVIEHTLAHGSMGTVYVARHNLTYARVALKLLRTEPSSDRQAEERFLREVRAAAQIGHDGIVKVQDAGKTPEGHLYLAMELLSGETLEQRIERSNGERLIAMDWLLAVLDPLAAAHENSIVHRDLKPANVFIARAPDGSERVKLLDFGLARDTREKSGTQTGIALGTPYYMSPEQAARPKDVSPASDVWSMGVMLYEVLTGCMPFDGETLHAVVISAATMPHVPVRDRVPELHPELAELVEDCLSKRPEARPHDASALRARLLPLLDDETVRADLARAAPSEPASPQLPGESMRMPFAETAIALAHDSRIEDVHPRVPKTGTGVWVSGVAVLALVIAGVFWALERSERSSLEAPPSTRHSAVTAPPREAATPRAQLPAEAPPEPDLGPVDHPRVPPVGESSAGGKRRPVRGGKAAAAQPANEPGASSQQADVVPPTAAQPQEATPPVEAAPVEPPAASSGEAEQAPAVGPEAPPVEVAPPPPSPPPEPEHTSETPVTP